MQEILDHADELVKRFEDYEPRDEDHRWLTRTVSASSPTGYRVRRTMTPMTNHVLFNPGPDSLVWHADGRAVDAQDRVTADPAEATVAALLARGALLDQGPADEPAAEVEASEPEAEPVEVLVDDTTTEPAPAAD